MEYKERFTNKSLKHSIHKRLNVGRDYECMFFDVFEDDCRKILIEAHPKDTNFNQLKPLVLTYAEIADTLEIGPYEVLSKLQEIGDLLIVENATILQLARFKPHDIDNLPLIIISVTETNNILEPRSLGLIAKPTPDDILPRNKINLLKGLGPQRAATKIQRAFRVNLSKNRVKLLKAKFAREEQLCLRTAYKDCEGEIYTISIFAGKLAYEIKAECMSRLLTCKMSKSDFLEYNFKSVRNIVSILQISKNQLTFLEKNSYSVKPAFIKVFQPQIKQMVSRKLLTLRTKKFADILHMLAIYEIKGGLLLECFKPDFKSNYRIISLIMPTRSLVEMFEEEKPLDEIIEVTKLVNGKLVVQPKNSLMKFVSNKNLLEIAHTQPNLYDSFKDFDALYRQRIISRGTKMLRQVLYIIIMSIDKTEASLKTVFNDSDKLTFEVISSSSVEAVQQVSIDLKSASHITGFSKDMLIPIGNMIVDQMLEFKDDKIIINSSVLLNFDKSASKIKAHMRGFVVRKNLQVSIKRMKNDYDGKLVLLKVIELNSKHFGVSVRLFNDEVRVEASNSECTLITKLSPEVFNIIPTIKPEKISAEFILSSLKIIEIDNVHKLVVDLATFKILVSRVILYEVKFDALLNPAITSQKQESPTLAKPLKVFHTEVVKRIPRMGSLKALIVPDSIPTFTIEYVDSYRSSMQCTTEDANPQLETEQYDLLSRTQDNASKENFSIPHFEALESTEEAKRSLFI